MEENINNVQQRAETSEAGITLGDLWRVFAKYFWRILIIAVVLTLIEAGVTKALIKTQYSATASIIMNPGLMDASVIDADAQNSATSTTNYSTLNANYNYYSYSIRFLPSIAKFIKTSQKIKDDVKAKAADQATYPDVEALKGSITVAYNEDELQIFVTYTTTTSAAAAKATIKAIVDSVCEKSKTQENGQYIYLWANTLHVDDLPRGASSTNNWWLYTLIAFVLFMVLAYLYYLIVTLTDDTIKSKREIEEISGFNVMAYVEDIDKEKLKKIQEKKAAAAAGDKK